MTTRHLRILTILTALLAAVAPPARAAGWRLVGWNNLGMHCMDADFAVFSILPPFNTIHAQLIDPQGNLVTDPAAAGIHVTFQAVADPDGSINTTSAGKTNFWEHALALFGAQPPVDMGLAGVGMPGAANVPQPMTWDAAAQWFVGAGVPITPYDDALHKNPYPLMRLVARDAGGVALAQTDIVLPVSDEMDCRACHASGSGAAARPPQAGWANLAQLDPQRDMRVNILQLHDELQASNPAYGDALEAAGYDRAGLVTTSILNDKAILCASCHASEALAAGGVPGVPALTKAMHAGHADVVDPLTGGTLDAADNRSACYRCHPGSETRCLRGAMGAAVAPDGSLAMQCQSCHGRMTDVGGDRTGWLDEPGCGNCHTGNAVVNAGAIRFDSVFDAPGHRRAPADDTFATERDTPGPGLSLYRFSSGHGGLQCSACHGSTHAEFPALHRNDNIQSQQVQGHVGVLVECTSCHATTPNTVAGGPHGMHPVGSTWVGRHGDIVEDGGTEQCRACHGADYRGTVLSRAQADHTLDADEFGRKAVWRGFQIGCFMCHAGPRSESASGNHPASVADASATTGTGIPVNVGIAASDADGNALVLRVVSQPAHGTAGLAGTTARYVPESGFVGTDTFTVAAWDGSIDSNLATVTVTVGPCTGRDLDGDGTPDTCDAADAALSAVTASLRTGAKGVAKATARVVTAPPGDVLSAAGGLTLAVADTGGLGLTRTWSAGECPATARGVVRCKSADRRATMILKPVKTAPGTWTLKATLRGATATTAPAGPVTVRLTHDGTVDRVGQAVACTAHATSIACR